MLVSEGAANNPIDRRALGSTPTPRCYDGAPLITPEKGQRKDDVMAVHLTRCTAPEGIVFVGRAQEEACALHGHSQPLSSVEPKAASGGHLKTGQ